MRKHGPLLVLAAVLGAAPVRAQTAWGDDKKVSPLVYVGFGVGGAGLVVGTVTGILSLSAASSAKEYCDGNRCRPAAQDDIDSSLLLANVANVGFAVGIVGVGLGIYGLATSDGGELSPPSALRVEPVIGARFLGARGTF